MDKNSRLINLVIALLATKKYLTKPQIFKAVEGYDSSPEAADRMFERDKEELRALGIEIEMKSVDPLFDDEIGYRILPERYKFDLGPLSAEEVSILAIAAQIWRESAFEDLAKSTSLRLESLGIVSDFSELPNESFYQAPPASLMNILNAIESQKLIEFNYPDLENALQSKTLAPHGVYTKGKNWYLYAQDQKDSSFKSYRLDRIDGEVKQLKKSFELSPVELPNQHFPPIETVLDIRRDSAHEIMSKADLISDENDWLKVRVVFNSVFEAKREILRNTPNVKVLEPKELKDEILIELDRLVALHEH